jgi:hypothetical protein
MLVLVTDVLGCLVGSGFGILSFFSFVVKVFLHYNVLMYPEFNTKLYTYGTKLYSLNKTGIDKFHDGMERGREYVKGAISWNQLSQLKHYIPGFAYPSHAKMS